MFRYPTLKIMKHLIIFVISMLAVGSFYGVNKSDDDFEGDFQDDNIIEQEKKKREKERKRIELLNQIKKNENANLAKIRANEKDKKKKKKSGIFSVGSGISGYLSPMLNTTTASFDSLNNKILVNNNFTFSAAIGVAYEMTFALLGKRDFLFGARLAYEPFWQDFELRETLSEDGDPQSKYYEYNGSRIITEVYVFESTKGPSLGLNLGFISYLPYSASVNVMNQVTADRSAFISPFVPGMRVGMSFAYFFKFGLALGVSLSWDIMFTGIERSSLNSTRVDSNQYQVFGSYRFYHFKR